MPRESRHDRQAQDLAATLRQPGQITDCPVIALCQARSVLMGLRHYQGIDGRHPGVWTLPGGRCHQGESLVEALLREVAEETGITDVQITQYLGSVRGTNDGDTVFIFVGQTLQHPQCSEPEKFSNWQWFDIGKLPHNALNIAMIQRVKAALLSNQYIPLSVVDVG